MENLDSIMRRINKLLSMAERTEGNENEAATAALMAAKLMEKYQIDHQDVIIKRLQDENEFCQEEVKGNLKVSKKWIGVLAIAIHYLFDVQVNCRKSYAGISYNFKGFKDDVAVAIYVFESLMNRINTEASHHLAVGKISGAGSSDAFKLAASMTIQSRAKKMKTERDAPTSESRALVVAKALAVANEFGEQRISQFRTSVKNPTASAYGHQAGERMEIGQRGIQNKDGVLALN